MPPYWRDTCAFSPDGRQLALQTAGGEAPAFIVWDTVAWKLLSRFARTSPDKGGVPMDNASAALSPDGRLLATGDAKRIVLVDTRTGKATHMLPPIEDDPLSFAFSPDGARLAVGDDDGNVRVISVTATALQ